MALINEILGIGTFELVRSRIAQVLATELANQKVLLNTAINDPETDPSLLPIYQLSYDSIPNEVWEERFIRPTEVILPFLNVVYVESEFDRTSNSNQNGDAKFMIEVWQSSPSTDEYNGDQRASLKLSRLLAICRQIIKDRHYLGLGLQRSIVGYINPKSIRIAQPDSGADNAANMIYGNIHLTAKMDEVVNGIPGELLDAVYTDMLLNSTSKGVRWEILIGDKPKRGYLYNVAAITNPNFVTIDDFRLATYQDWDDILNFTGSETFDGLSNDGALIKDATSWTVNCPTAVNGANTTGLSILHAGYRWYGNNGEFRYCYSDGALYLTIYNDIVTSQIEVKRLVNQVEYDYNGAYAHNGYSVRLVYDGEGTPRDLVRDADGNIYEVVEINGKYWIKQNYACTVNADGTPIENIQDGEEWENATGGAYCAFDNDNDYVFE
jgi:uncharacterized protein (TIGR02145 family)